MAFVEIFASVFVSNEAGDIAQGEFGEVGGVRTHVGDESLFVELLCHAHRGADAETELAAGLLLERGCGERG